MRFANHFSLAVLCILLTANFTHAQDNYVKQAAGLTISGFADTYYVFDFNKPLTDYRQEFLCNHNRHNEFNVNLALLNFSINHERYRANIALQSGTYASDNYAAEHPVMQHIFEANAGIALDPSGKIWLDAGVMPSHIGFESAISSDNLTLTRSLLAENSPYFLTGAKLSYEANEKLYLALLLVNGWQRIRRLPGNSMLSWGTQLKYTISEKVLFNWSTFFGADDPDDSRRFRVFNNFYTIVQLTERVKLIAGTDVGIQQSAKGSDINHYWVTPIAITQLNISSQWDCAARVEYFGDKNGAIILTENFNGFQTTGLSFNLDYRPAENVMLRFEARYLKSKEAIFEHTAGLRTDNFIIASSLAVKF